MLDPKRKWKSSLGNQISLRFDPHPDKFKIPYWLENQIAQLAGAVE